MLIVCHIKPDTTIICVIFVVKTKVIVHQALNAVINDQFTRSKAVKIVLLLLYEINSNVRVR